MQGLKQTLDWLDEYLWTSEVDGTRKLWKTTPSLAASWTARPYKAPAR